jgi:hypothetical protein
MISVTGDPSTEVERGHFRCATERAPCHAPISIEDDVATVDELLNLVENLRMGPLLAVHDDIASEFVPLDVPEQTTVFVALYYTFGTEIGAMKRRIGIG